MKTFRRKFTKTLQFSNTIVLIVSEAILIPLMVVSLSDRSKEVILGGVLLLLGILLTYTLRNLFICCYITTTDTEIMFMAIIYNFTLNDIPKPYNFAAPVRSPPHRRGI